MKKLVFESPLEKRVFRIEMILYLILIMNLTGVKVDLGQVFPVVSAIIP